MSAPASAQSFIEVTGGPTVEAPAAVGAPMSITQRYVPRATATRDLSLLVDESQIVAAAAPVANINVTSSAPSAPALLASNDLGVGLSSITVSNVRGFHEQE